MYLRLLIFLPAILILACVSSSLGFHTMYSAYELNKQGDNIQPRRTPFPVLNQSVASCQILTVASWPAYRFLRRLITWSGIPISLRIPQFVVIHTVKGFSIVKEEEVVVFLEFPCFLYDQTNVGHLISGSSGLTQLIYLEVHSSGTAEAQLEGFWAELSSTWNEHNCMVVWTFFGIALLWDWSENCMGSPLFLTNCTWIYNYHKIKDLSSKKRTGASKNRSWKRNCNDPCDESTVFLVGQSEKGGWKEGYIPSGKGFADHPEE